MNNVEVNADLCERPSVYIKVSFFCCQQMTVLSGFAYNDERWTAESIFVGIVEVVDSCYDNYDAIRSGFHLKCFLDNISDQKCSCSPIYLNKDQKYSSTSLTYLDLTYWLN